MNYSSSDFEIQVRKAKAAAKKEDIESAWQQANQLQENILAAVGEVDQVTAELALCLALFSVVAARKDGGRASLNSVNLLASAQISLLKTIAIKTNGFKQYKKQFGHEPFAGLTVA